MHDAHTHTLYIHYLKFVWGFVKIMLLLLLAGLKTHLGLRLLFTRCLGFVIRCLIVAMLAKAANLHAPVLCPTVTK